MRALIRLLLCAACLPLVACEDLGLMPGGNPGGGGGPAPTAPVSTDGLSAFALVQPFTHNPADGVFARFGVIKGSGSGASYSGGITRPRLLQDTHEFDLASDAQYPGLYTISSATERQLTWNPASTYRFVFDVTDQNGTRTQFSHVLTPPRTAPRIELAAHQLVLYANEPVEFEASGFHDGVAVLVTQTHDVRQRPLQPARLTFNSFGYSTPATLDLALTSLQIFRGRSIVIPREAFPHPGVYDVTFQDYRVTQGNQTTPALRNDALFLIGAAYTVSLVIE